MDAAESTLKPKSKASAKAAASGPRAKAITWPVAISEFLLDWYIEKKLHMPPKASFKKMHHTACTAAVNSKYGTTYTVDQVYRHFRRHRDTWVLVARHLKESGNGWDDSTKTMTLSEATLSSLSANDRGVLTKPIQFYDKLEELFIGSSADGSFMQDACTAAESDNDDIDKMDMMNDMSAYAETDVPKGEDSDKLESDSDDCQEVAALAADASQVSSSNMESLKPNKKIFKRSAKSKSLPVAGQIDRAAKSKPKSSANDNNDMDLVLTTTLQGIKKTLEKPVQVAPPPDPNAPLWDMLKNIVLTPDDRIAVGMHLCKPEFQVNRSFLISMGQEYLERWVFQYLSGGDPGMD